MRLKSIQLEKAFQAAAFEKRIYALWKNQGYFSPQIDTKDTVPYVIVIPPPNVTGVLHMGHGLNNALQDILIRYYRMLGRQTLWVPGTDHAGIATQNVVERTLLEEGSSREELGREKFVERVWQVKEKHHAIIVKQLERIGASCDWDRERFTFDEGMNRAVKEVFVQLYERDLIYKGEYLINWCCGCGTALSDDEVEHKEHKGSLWHLRYPLADGTGYIEVATTRPETMLGDTAVAVHPDDDRYTALHGKTVILPLTKRKVPIIADTYVDTSFGSGAVKITPAHDVNDWEIGRRHNLDCINILTKQATLNDAVPEKYRGLGVQEARKAVIHDLTEQGYMLRMEKHSHQVGHCYRCNAVIEPWQSKQWFVRMKPLAEKALAAWRRGEIRFFPKHWEHTYVHWLENIRDWCISRQLWWGHRIPVWYDMDTGEMIASRDNPAEQFPDKNLKQDEDVLDTWFSSWLWPFSVFGWPEQTEDMARFYPTTTLVTGYDIIFFWVARMVMAGLEFMGRAPFRDIYITGLVRDSQGRKMSKSLNNGLDPLEVVEKYGADAHKFTLAYLSIQGQDVPISMDSFQLGSKFANKVWNAARYLLMNLQGRDLLPFADIALQDSDSWILLCLSKAVTAVSKAMKEYRMDEAAHAAYDFFWSDFCDWYIEISKLRLYADEDKEKDEAASLLLYVLEESLRLLHPFLSFITEEIYQKLPYAMCPADGSSKAAQIIAARYPRVHAARDTQEIREMAKKFANMQELVRGIRTLRSEFAVSPSAKIPAYVLVRNKTEGNTTEEDKDMTAFLQKHVHVITALSGLSELAVGDNIHKKENAVVIVAGNTEVCLYIRDMIDVAKQCALLEKRIQKVQKAYAMCSSKLANKGFITKAKPEVIDIEMQRAKELEMQLSRMMAIRDELAS